MYKRDLFVIRRDLVYEKRPICNQKRHICRKEIYKRDLCIVGKNTCLCIGKEISAKKKDLSRLIRQKRHSVQKET